MEQNDKQQDNNKLMYDFSEININFDQSEKVDYESSGQNNYYAQSVYYNSSSQDQKLLNQESIPLYNPDESTSEFQQQNQYQQKPQMQGLQNQPNKFQKQQQQQQQQQQFNQNQQLNQQQQQQHKQQYSQMFQSDIITNQEEQKNCTLNKPTVQQQYEQQQMQQMYNFQNQQQQNQQQQQNYVQQQQQPHQQQQLQQQKQESANQNSFSQSTTSVQDNQIINQRKKVQQPIQSQQYNNNQQSQSSNIQFPQVESFFKVFFLSHSNFSKRYQNGQYQLDQQIQIQNKMKIGNNNDIKVENQQYYIPQDSLVIQENSGQPTIQFNNQEQNNPIKQNEKIPINQISFYKQIKEAQRVNQGDIYSVNQYLIFVKDIKILTDHRNDSQSNSIIILELAQSEDEVIQQTEQKEIHLALSRTHPQKLGGNQIQHEIYFQNQNYQQNELYFKFWYQNGTVMIVPNPQCPQTLWQRQSINQPFLLQNGSCYRICSLFEFQIKIE